MSWLEKFWIGCGRCNGPEACPLAEPGECGPAGVRREELRGARFVVSVTAVFLLPLATAIGGAYLLGHWGADASFGSLGRWQTGGAVAGLLLGVGLARLLLVRGHWPGASTDGDA